MHMHNNKSYKLIPYILVVKPFFSYLQGCNEDVMFLSLDSILNGHSVLIFCPSKNWCETLANKISALIKRIGKLFPPFNFK